MANGDHIKLLVDRQIGHWSGALNWVCGEVSLVIRWFYTPLGIMSVNVVPFPRSD